MSMIKKTGLYTLAISMLLGLIACSSEPEEVVLTSGQEKEVVERLAPEGEVTLASDVVATAPSAGSAASSGPRAPEDIYNKACTTCHTAGVAGAPRVGEVADWTARMANGIDTVYSNAINGLNGMPPRGLCMDCSDDELKAVVDYMVENSQ